MILPLIAVAVLTLAPIAPLPVGEQLLLGDDDALAYLRTFGYLKHANDFASAVKQFQRFAQLPISGQLDAATRRKMMQPRCGNRDVESIEDELPNPLERRRQKRYAIEGSYWGVTNITYRIGQYTDEMDMADVDDVIGRAFQVWEESSPLRFEKKAEGPVNVEILFARRSHGDGEPFDGRGTLLGACNRGRPIEVCSGQILAHAFFPRYGGDVHFDDEEPWRALQAKGIDLYSVAAHEIGHSLGLKHSQNHDALMAPFYQQGYDDDAIRLHADDIKGLQHLYGKPNTASKPDKPGVPVPKPQAPESSSSDICVNPRIDAITVLGNGTTYAFRGAIYWKLNQLSFEEGYPRNISADWDGLPNDLDAAVTDADGDTYFFKGENYWLYNRDGRRYEGYPRKIHVGLVDLPSNIEAALIWNYDEKPYFFKGGRYWQYSRWGMPETWPRSTSQIFADLSDGAPLHIDAALRWTNGKSYLFAGPYYYRLSGYRVLKVVAGYPRLTAEWWFGCPSKSRRKRSARLR